MRNPCTDEPREEGQPDEPWERGDESNDRVPGDGLRHPESDERDDDGARHPASGDRVVEPGERHPSEAPLRAENRSVDEPPLSLKAEPDSRQPWSEPR